MATDNVTPLTAAEQRIALLAQARELQKALRELAKLPEFGEGSCPMFAADLMDGAIGYLTPTPPEPGEDADPDDAKGGARWTDPPRPRLRLVGRP